MITDKALKDAGKEEALKLINKVGYHVTDIDKDFESGVINIRIEPDKLVYLQED